jgi:hypothetical protein
VPDKASLLTEIKNFNAGNKVRVIELPEPAGFQHVVFSKKNGKLAKRFDDAFEKINGNQKYSELLSKYMDVSKL